MYKATSVSLSRRAVVRGLAAGIGAAMLPAVVGRQVWAAETDCQSVWGGFESLGKTLVDIAKGLGDIIGVAPKAAGLQDVQTVTQQSLMIANGMAKVGGEGIARGAVAQGVQSQAAYIQSALKKLGPAEAQRRLELANQAIASGQYEAVAKDPVFGPVVNAGVESYKQFTALLQRTAGAMQQMEQNNLALFAQQLSDARSAKQLTDEHIKALLKIYGENKGITEVLMRVGAIRIGSAALPSGLLTAGVNSAFAESTVAATCGSCRAEPSGGNRWLAWLGIGEAKALTGVEEVIVATVIVLAVMATVSYIATLWGYNKCVQTTETANRFDECMANAQRQLDEAHARAERHHQECLRQEICAFGLCAPQPAFVCDSAYGFETAGAFTVFWASEAACYLIS